ncbi:hypothetical protein E8E12_002676 [Didymella heteroderae]|uniref:Uncharacterized protein n=1 Tax=Didymella heteroderae TaxID=1769908 RepID=A0A9P5BWE6_9PLEO|nr:hypothetical protein E8E12_002676 [Didymella heteroderae]
MAHKVSDLPPVIKQQRQKEHKVYLKRQPDARVRSLCDYAKNNSSQFTLADFLALAFESLKEHFGALLPPGVYANSLGHWFEIKPWGEETALQFAPPQGRIWDPTRMTPSSPPQLPLELQFAAGRWVFPAQIFNVGAFSLNVPAGPRQNLAAAIQMQQPPAILAHPPTGPCVPGKQENIDPALPAGERPLPSPATSQQPHRSATPSLGDFNTAAFSAAHVAIVKQQQQQYPEPLLAPSARSSFLVVVGKQAASVSAAKKRKATDDGTEGKKRTRTEDKSGVAKPATVPSMVEQEPTADEADEAILDFPRILEVDEWNTQNAWPDEETRLRHVALNASSHGPSLRHEFADAVDMEDLALFPDLPTISYPGYAPAVGI